ncbi:hypothetical protein KI387_028986, partial [Taxus chinensis]
METLIRKCIYQFMEYPPVLCYSLLVSEPQSPNLVGTYLETLCSFPPRCELPQSAHHELLFGNFQRTDHDQGQPK